MTSQWPLKIGHFLPGLPEGVPIFGAAHHRGHIPEVVHKRRVWENLLQLAKSKRKESRVWPILPGNPQ